MAEIQEMLNYGLYILTLVYFIVILICTNCMNDKYNPFTYIITFLLSFIFSFFTLCFMIVVCYFIMHTYIKFISLVGNF